MQRSRQIALMERISANEKAGTTDMSDDAFVNPVSAYLSPERFAAEWALLSRLPLVACLSCDVASPGDFKVVDVLDRSIVIVRGTDGVVRALHNVCSHRASRLVDGCGHRAGGFRCPYHAWRYGLDGSLVSRPNNGGFEGLQLDRDGALAPLACEELAGIVFVRIEGDGPVRAGQWLGAAADELDEFDLSSFHPVESRVSRHTMNWKLMQDTFLEAYHIPYLHAKTFGPILRDDQVWDCWGPHSRNVGPRKDISEAGDESAVNWSLARHAVIGYNLFPNVNLTYGSDHFVLFRIYPVALSACYAEITWYVADPPNGADELSHWQRTIEFASRVTEEEDFAAQETIQQNLRSGAVSGLVYGRNEPALIHYHKTLSAMLEAPVQVGYTV